VGSISQSEMRSTLRREWRYDSTWAPLACYALSLSFLGPLLVGLQWCIKDILYGWPHFTLEILILGLNMEEGSHDNDYFINLDNRFLNINEKS
jgi:membrane protein required for beta-lactamase induction